MTERLPINQSLSLIKNIRKRWPAAQDLRLVAENCSFVTPSETKRESHQGMVFEWAIYIRLENGMIGAAWRPVNEADELVLAERYIQRREELQREWSERRLRRWKGDKDG